MRRAHRRGRIELGLGLGLGLMVLAGCGGPPAGSAAITGSTGSTGSAVPPAATSSAGSGPTPSTATPSPATSPAATSPAESSPVESSPAGGGEDTFAIGLNPDWLDRGLRVVVRVGGGAAQPTVVDTGSNGVVVARRYLGPAAQSLSPRQTFTDFTYSSSGNHYSGEWVRAQVAIASTGGGGAVATTAPMLVRAVDSMCDKAGRCTTDPGAVDVAMLGVGFDRAADRAAAPANSGPDINPFLQIEQMASGTMRRAYGVAAGVLTLGVTTQQLAGFRQVPLQHTTSQPVDWQAPTACVQVAGSVAAQCGSMLLDTGLDYAILQVPAGRQPPTSAPVPGTQRRLVSAGQQISVTVPALGAAPVYAFTVGAAGAPRQVQWGHALLNGASFFNLSRYALTGTDYLYDATDGLLGLRPRTTSGSPAPSGTVVVPSG